MFVLHLPWFHSDQYFTWVLRFRLPLHHSIKCLFENKLHFEVHSEQCLLRPGETSEFLVVFRPTQAISYEDKIEFEVNGLSKTSIAVRGVGVPMKVSVVILQLFPQNVKSGGKFLYHTSTQPSVFTAY